MSILVITVFFTHFLIFRLVEGQFEDDGYSSMEKSTSSLSPTSSSDCAETTDGNDFVYPDFCNLNDKNKNEPKLTNVRKNDNQQCKDLQTVGKPLVDLHTNNTVHAKITNVNCNSITSSESLHSVSNRNIYKHNKMLKSTPKVKIWLEDLSSQQSPVAKNITPTQVECVMENLMKQQNSNKHMYSPLSRGMSLSTPEFGSYLPRARTISERLEENDMVSLLD